MHARPSVTTATPGRPIAPDRLARRPIPPATAAVTSTTPPGEREAACVTAHDGVAAAWIAQHAGRCAAQRLAHLDRPYPAPSGAAPGEAPRRTRADAGP